MLTCTIFNKIRLCYTYSSASLFPQSKVYCRNYAKLAGIVPTYFENVCTIFSSVISIHIVSCVLPNTAQRVLWLFLCKCVSVRQMPWCGTAEKEKMERDRQWKRKKIAKKEERKGWGNERKDRKKQMNSKQQRGYGIFILTFNICFKTFCRLKQFTNPLTMNESIVFHRSLPGIVLWPWKIFVNLLGENNSSFYFNFPTRDSILISHLDLFLCSLSAHTLFSFFY